MELVNKVAQSGLINFNLEDLYPKEEIVLFDISEFLFKGLLLKEKDFRSAMKEIDWSQYEGKILLTFCSTDAIVPHWAFMLISKYAAPFSKAIFQGTEQEYLKAHYAIEISKLSVESYVDQRIVIKGCGEKPVPVEAYSALTFRLQPHAKSIMYGEPCSTVPIYKKPRK